MSEFNISFEKSVGIIDQLPVKTIPEIVLSGKSNVGKSSLINAIISKKIAYTSKTAGKTILINFYKSKKFRIVDVPGYGFNNRSKDEQNRFNKLTDEYFKRNRSNLVLHLIDSRNDLQENDALMIKFLSDNNIKFCIVFTKIDKLSKSASEKQILNLRSQIDKISEKCIDFIPISSKKGENINKVKGLILSVIRGR